MSLNLKFTWPLEKLISKGSSVSFNSFTSSTIVFLGTMVCTGLAGSFNSNDVKLNLCPSVPTMLMFFSFGFDQQAV